MLPFQRHLSIELCLVSLTGLRIGKVTQKRKVFLVENLFLIDKVTRRSGPFVTSVTTRQAVTVLQPKPVHQECSHLGDFLRSSRRSLKNNVRAIASWKLTPRGASFQLADFHRLARQTCLESVAARLNTTAHSITLLRCTIGELSPNMGVQPAFQTARQMESLLE